MSKLLFIVGTFSLIFLSYHSGQAQGVHSEGDIILEGDPVDIRFHQSGSLKSKIGYDTPDLIFENLSLGNLIWRVSGGASNNMTLENDGTLRTSALKIDPLSNSIDSEIRFNNLGSNKYTLKYNHTSNQLELDGSTILGLFKIDEYGNQMIGDENLINRFRLSLTSPLDGTTTNSSAGSDPAAMLKLSEGVASRFGRIHFNNVLDEYWQIQARATNTNLGTSNDQDPEMRFYFYDSDDGNGRTILSIDGDDNSVAINKTSAEAHLHIKQNKANEEALAMENNGEGNDIWAFEIATDDLDLIYEGTVVGTFDHTGGTYTPSDRRLKRNISALQSGQLNKIMQLNPSKYYYKHDHEQSKKQFGFIAQELEQVYPEMVSPNESTGYLMIKYNELIPVLTSAIQELKIELDDLKEIVLQQKKEIRKQKQ